MKTIVVESRGRRLISLSPASAGGQVFHQALRPVVAVRRTDTSNE